MEKVLDKKFELALVKSMSILLVFGWIGVFFHGCYYSESESLSSNMIPYTFQSEIKVDNWHFGITHESAPAIPETDQKDSYDLHEVDNILLFRMMVINQDIRMLTQNLCPAMEGNNRIDPAGHFYFGLQNNIVLVSGLDTAKCVFYHAEPSFGIRPHHVLFLGFEFNSPTTHKQDKNKIIIRDDCFSNRQLILDMPKLN